MTTKETKPLASSWTGRGTGTELLGETGHQLVLVDSRLEVSVVKTKFFCLLNVPLIPLASYRVVIGKTTTEGNLLSGMTWSTQLSVLQRLRLQFRQVVEVYAFTLLCLLWWPLAPPAIRELPAEWPIARIVALLGGFALWCAGCLSLSRFFLKRRRKSAILAQLALLRKTREAEESERNRREQDHTRFMPPGMRSQPTSPGDVAKRAAPEK